MGSVPELDTPTHPVARWLTAWTVIGCVAALSDTVVTGLDIGLRIELAGLGLTVLWSLCAGLLCAGTATISQRLPKLLMPLPWLALLGAYFARTAIQLGVLRNLNTRHHRLALFVALGCAAATVALTAVACLAQPPRHGGRSPIARLKPRWSWAFIILLLLSAVAISVADHLAFPGTYSQAHQAMRVAALFLGAVALHLCGVTVPAKLRRRRPAIGGAAVIAVIVLAPFFLVTNDNLAVSTTLAARPFQRTFLQIARATTDFDGDGFSAWLGGGDCAPFNAKINPAGFDIPDNGVDENCLAGDATFGQLDKSWPLPPKPSVRSPMNVVLITVDTLRADRMSAYGAKRDTTPNIKRWASRAQRFDAAYTSGLWTSIALPSLMHGLYARRLRWTLLLETTRGTMRATERLEPDQKVRAKFVLPVDDPRPTLAELLSRRGMRTTAVVDDGFTDIIAPEWGFGRGFASYRRVKDAKRWKRDDATTATLAIRQLTAGNRDRPFFMWVHFFGPHKPDRKHKSVPEFGTTIADKYDHEIAYADEHVGRLIRSIEQLNDPTAVILTADHGEYLYRTGRSHGHNAREGNVRVPLLIEAPGWGSGRSDVIVSTVDIAATILALTETPAPTWLDGIDLKQACDRPSDFANRVVFADSFIYDKRGPERFRFALAAAIAQDHKLLHQRFRRTTRFVRRLTDRRDKTANPAHDRLQQALTDYFEATGGTPSPYGRRPRPDPSPK